MECSLPAELWSRVLRFVTLDDNVNEDDQLLLLHPASSYHLSLSNKRSVVNVCRKWRRLAIEYLWESVGNVTLAQLVALAGFLRKDARRTRLLSSSAGQATRHGQHSGCEDGSSTDGDGGSGELNAPYIPRGWWVRSLVTRFNFGDDLATFVQAITAIFPFCPNLTSFKHIHDFNGPLPTSVITALASYCGRTLVWFQLDWGGVNIDDLIHLLDQSTALQHIGLGCTFDPPSSNLLPLESQEARKRDLHFPNLCSLQFGNSEDGMFRRFNSHLLEAASWNVPSLTAVVIDLDARTSIEEVMGFLQVHGRKLRTLSLTDSGRNEGISIGWNEIFGMCPQLTDMRLAYNPFFNFNIEAFTSDFVAKEVNGETSAELSVAPVAQGELPILPDLITSPLAVQLQRLCFDKWEFFPGMDCTTRHTDDDGDQDMFLPSADEFLARVTADQVEAPIQVESAEHVQQEEEQDIAAQEHSERLVKGYCRVLDHIFGALGGKLTPALRVIQFDFHAGRLDLPESSWEWWNGWLSEWNARGLRIEGCQHVSL